MAPSPWNDGTDRQLLLTIIHLTAPQAPDWNKIALMMGEGFTSESVRQHFQKMRNDCKAKCGEPADVPKGTPAKGLPRKANGGTPAKSTGKRKGRKDAKDEDGDDDENESPSKKVAVKAEKKEEDDSF